MPRTGEWSTSGGPLGAAARRRRALGAVAAVAAVAGILTGALSSGGGDSREDGSAGGRDAALAAAPRPADVAAAERLPLDRAAGLLVVLRFRGTSPPAYVLRALRDRRAGGVILFRDNVVSPGQLRALTGRLQRAAGGRAIVATDQEGGEVRRLPWAAPVRSQHEQLARGTVAAEARAGARDLRRAGVNVVFAPVADVPGGSRSALAGRAFSRDSGKAARAIGASVRAWRAGGVLPTLKHFPGLGRATTNTDLGAATVTGLGAADLAPFKAGIAAGAPLVMASHALYPQLDSANIASQSRAILTGLLRGRLRFAGVVVTDSLEAKAVTSRSDVGSAAVRSVAAGADLALTTGRGSFLPVLTALRARAHADPAFATRVRESAARVIALRARLGAR